MSSPVAMGLSVSWALSTLGEMYGYDVQPGEGSTTSSDDAHVSAWQFRDGTKGKMTFTIDDDGVPRVEIVVAETHQHDEWIEMVMEVAIETVALHDEVRFAVKVPGDPATEVHPRDTVTTTSRVREPWYWSEQ